MGSYVSPGHYYRELDFSEYAPLLSTSIVGFVGTAIKGPINELTYITSLEQAVEVFGQPTPDSYLLHSIKAAFEKIDKCWVVRVCGGSSDGSPYTSASKATISIDGAASPGFEAATNFELYTIAASSPAQHIGTELENFNIVAATNDGISVRVDTGAGWGATQSITIAAGTYTASQLAVLINAGTTGINCTDDGNGYLQIETAASGSDDRVELLAVANDMYTDTGLTIGIYTGSDGTDYLEVVLVGVGAGTQTFTLTAGNRTAVQIAADINLTATDFEAVANDSGGCDLYLDNTGTANSIQVHSDSTCDSVLGWDNAVHAGTDGTSTTATIWAATEGSWANYLGEKPGLYVKIVDGTVGTTFAIEVYTANDVLRTKFDNLEKDPNSSNYYVDVIGTDDSWISVVDVPAISSFPINGTYQLALGADGISDLVDADYIGTISGSDRYGLQLYANPESVDLNILSVPGATSQSIHTEMLSICENDRKDCLAILDGPQSLTVQQMVDFTNGEGSYSSRTALNSSYGAIYYDWVRVYDEYTPDDPDRWIPPSGFAIAVMAHTDNIADTWWAPAGMVRGRLLTALEVGTSPDKGERDLMQSGGNAVNPLVDFVGEGICVFGQHTLQRRDTSLKYINVRRMLLYAEKVVATSVKYLVFEQNDSITWRRYTRLVNPIFEAIKRRRGLYDFRVVCDETTNPADQIAQGVMKGKILLQPTIAAEIIVTDFVLMPTGASFEEF